MKKERISRNGGRIEGLKDCKEGSKEGYQGRKEYISMKEGMNEGCQGRKEGYQG